jgi:hypothetical protein
MLSMMRRLRIVVQMSLMTLQHLTCVQHARKDVSPPQVIPVGVLRRVSSLALTTNAKALICEIVLHGQGTP